jgi:ribulose-phosphate 3-epimerase
VTSVWQNRRGVEIEPSLYAADFNILGAQIEELMEAGVRIFHYDVGDGHFVPPVTIGPIVLESIGPRIHNRRGLIDVHLMVTNPVHHFEQVKNAGGDSVTFHYEAVEDVPGTLAAARDLGLGAGVALNPETSPEDVAAVAGDADLVLCMSIHPGYSGQPFMTEALDRIRTLRGLLPEAIPIQVDGGVGHDNAPQIVAAGATLLVVGSHIFGAPDIGESYRSRSAEPRAPSHLRSSSRPRRTATSASLTPAARR